MTFTLDQNWGTPGSGSSAVATQTGTATAAGATLFVVVAANASATFTVSDSAGGANTWQQAVLYDSTQTIALFYALAASPVTSVTVTASGSPTRTMIGLASYTNDGGDVSLTDTASATGTSGTSWSPLEVTPAAAGDLVIGGIEFFTSSRIADTTSPFARLYTRQQSFSLAAGSGLAPDTDDIGPAWTLTSGTAAAPLLITAAFTEAPSSIDVTGTVTDNLARIDATPESGTPPFAYTITQTSGPSTTPVEIDDGVWTVVKHATDPLAYEVTVTDDNDLVGTDTITVPPRTTLATGPKHPTGTLPSSTWE